MWLRLLLAALVPATVVAQLNVDRRLGTFRAQQEAHYLWSGDSLKRLAPGFEDVLADMYWLRTVQYFGGQRVYAEGKRFDLLHPLIEITTTLDPRLTIAYKYGAIFLSEPKPLGAGDPKSGIAVLEKGVAAMPENWRLRQDLGFFQFLFLKDAASAVRILNEASEIPGAPFWLRTLAAQTAAESGERNASRSMWEAMFQQSDEGPIRENARTNLQILTALDGRDFLVDKVKKFREANGRWPTSLDELVRARLIREVPLDPAGSGYDYDSTSGLVNVGKRSSLYRPMFDLR